MMECNCNFVVESEDEQWEKHYLTCAIRLAEREINGEFPNGIPRNNDGTLRFQNSHLKNISDDFLYHLNLSTAKHDLKFMFADVKFVCMGGTASRMQQIVKYLGKELGYHLPVGSELIDMTVDSHRYSMYKIGPILAVNHGIGISTLSVVLQEIIKLLIYSGVKDPILFRIGTSGGIGVKPGTVVITDQSFDGLMNNSYDLPILGKMVSMPAIFDKRLGQELKSMAKEEDNFETIIANTMGSSCFYNGQGRTDGPFCDYNEEDKMIFLKKLFSKGIRNIEMEATCFSALTYKAGIKAADVCVTLIDRLKGDQVLITTEDKALFEMSPIIIVSRFMKRLLKK